MKMTRTLIVITAAGIAILCLSSWALADAEGDYKTLFGQEEAKVVSGRNTKEAAAFAAKVFNAAKSTGDQKDLQILLCEKAYDFGMKDPSGYQTAIDAMRLVIEVSPAKKPQAQDKLLKTSQLRYAKSTGAERKRLGEEMVGLLIAAGDQREAKEPDDALALYRQAFTLATSAGSIRTKEITGRIRRISSRQAAERKLAELKEKLNAAPNNAALRTQLILLHLGESDRPAEAVKLLTGDLDEKLRTYVPLSVKPVADLDERVCLELAYWYAEIAENASAADKGVLLGKAMACCQRYLELHTTQDAARLKGTLLLEKVAKGADADVGALHKDLTLELGKDVTMKLVLIPAGKFMMGSLDNEADHQANESPRHEVAISKPFYLGVYEVTQQQYEAVMGANPSRFKGANNPVEQVAWADAVTFCKKLSAKTGKTVRLPTEAQWEYACRAGSKTRFGCGDTDSDLPGSTWLDWNAGGKTHPVGEKKPNRFGLHDMHGNVWEWCADWYADSYTRPPAGQAGAIDHDPAGAASGDHRVARGGSWQQGPHSCRSAGRNKFPPGSRDSILGFRVVVGVGRVE